MRRRTVAMVMVVLLTLGVVSLEVHVSNAAAPNDAAPTTAFCTPVRINIAIGNVVMNDVVVLTNTNAVDTLVSVTWSSGNGTSNTITFNMPGRSFRATTPAEAGFPAIGLYSLRAQAGVVAAILRTQNGIPGDITNCYLLD